MTAVLQRYFDEHRGLLSVVLGVVICNLLFYFAALLPLETKVVNMRASHTTRQQTVRTALEDYGRVLLEKAVLENADGRITRLRSELLRIKSERFPIVDVELKKLQKEFGWTGHALSYTYSDEPILQLIRFTTAFQLKGTYKSLRKFVSAVEQATDDEGRDLFFAIEAVNIADSTTAGRELNLEVRLATYFYDPKLGAKIQERLRQQRERREKRSKDRPRRKVSR